MTRSPRLAVGLAAGLVLTLAACSAAATPSPSAPSSSPGGSAGPSGGASVAPSFQVVSPSPGSVTTPEQAAALVIASNPQFAGIGPLDPDLIGQSAWYTVDPASDGWTVVVTIGWGDCPSGCIEKHIWTYAVTTDGQVTLMAETGPAVPSELPG